MRNLFVWLIMAKLMMLAELRASSFMPIDSVMEDLPIVGKNWSEVVKFRGYAQLRYNRLLETNPLLACDQCDKSWGENGGFFFRRIRMIFSGDIHERIYFYIQPDFASGGSHLAQIRDAYFDLALDAKQELRLRIGQSKVPFGYENLQSSQNRIPLDRNDGLNSAVANERDIGLMLYFAPSKIRERFRYLVSSGLKGSGDYGVLAIGAYNGQTANQPEKNNSLHTVGRVSYPFELGNGQFIEGSLQGYSGKFVINRQMLVDDSPTEFREYRYGATLVVFPQPFGLQAEYNWGRGPEFNPTTGDIDNKPLEGGYLLASYYVTSRKSLYIPFSRYHYYSGGKKHEFDATKHRVKEWEIGVEWQPNRNFELVAMYTVSDRTFENSLNPSNRQRGSLLRLQAQVNF
ncbi:porin [Lunatimonas sp.]|uniref:porin n=1 Tax=Lunatimonas sp. TaxID=2060141 RepID=UPI00263B9633|nr:porin [Lunatimonas sp.]